jgi:hypothetical protein
MCGPIPRVRVPAALSVHHGPEQWSGSRLTRARARGHSGEWELTVSWGKGRGAPGGVLTEGTKGRHGGGIGRATVNGGGGGWGSVGMCFEAGRGEKSSGRSWG